MSNEIIISETLPPTEATQVFYYSTMHAYQGFIISLHKQAVCTKLNDWIALRITQVCDFATVGAVAVAIIVQLDTLPLSSTLAITIDSQYEKFIQGGT